MQLPGRMLPFRIKLVRRFGQMSYTRTNELSIYAERKPFSTAVRHMPPPELRREYRNRHAGVFIAVRPTVPSESISQNNGDQYMYQPVG